MSILLKKGRVIDPGTKLDAAMDLFIDEGKIKKIGSNLSSASVKASTVIDCQGLWVIPGMIDMHTHLRDPGRPDKETIASGARAAALGGFTSICCMANTNPPIDNPAVVEYVLAKARSEAVVNVYPVAAVTKGLKGEELAEMGRCHAEGAIAFSDDGRPVMRSDVMRRALEYAKQFHALIISHCQDLNLSQGSLVNESLLSTAIGMLGTPALAEEIMVARDIMLAKQYGRVHIAHVSSAGAVDLIRKAKKAGAPVTCETCPHYFTLTEEAAREYDTNAKVNPPLRGKADLLAIIRGLKDGTIDVIATDHAPHNIEEKKIEFDLAASGMIGLETALGLVITKLVDTKVLTPKQAVEKLSVAPARVLGLNNKGKIKVGADADITIVDPQKEWTVDVAQFASRSKNSPFNGWKLKGKVVHTIVAGKVVVSNGKLLN
jgi:dihydroorotase